MGTREPNLTIYNGIMADACSELGVPKVSGSHGAAARIVCKQVCQTCPVADAALDNNSYRESAERPGDKLQPMVPVTRDTRGKIHEATEALRHGKTIAIEGAGCVASKTFGKVSCEARVVIAMQEGQEGVEVQDAPAAEIDAVAIVAGADALAENREI